MCTSHENEAVLPEGQHCDDISSNMRSAFVPKEIAWRGYSQLRVKFLTEIPEGWSYGGDPLNIGNIMSWANEWRGDNIPEFILARGNEPAEVRLLLNSEYFVIILASLVPRPLLVIFHLP